MKSVRRRFAGAAGSRHSFAASPMDLKQFSARLGLSPTTVSRALNGYSDVSEPASG